MIKTDDPYTIERYHFENDIICTSFKSMSVGNRIELVFTNDTFYTLAHMNPITGILVEMRKKYYHADLPRSKIKGYAKLYLTNDTGSDRVEESMLFLFKHFIHIVSL